jgi:hypothetical protein
LHGQIQPGCFQGARHAAWVRRHRLDAVLFTACPSLDKKLAAAGLRAPEQIGLANTDWNLQEPHIAGMD